MATVHFLSSPILHPSLNRKVNGTTIDILNCSFYGRLIRHPNPIQRDSNQSCRNRSMTITSLVEEIISTRICLCFAAWEDSKSQAGNFSYHHIFEFLLFYLARVGSDLKESGENVSVEGKNRWKYSTFINWEFWWLNFPILVYSKERQTKAEGRIQFFPIILNGKQLYDVMVERAGPSKTSGPEKA